jgi:hypothetical protein
VRVKDWRAYHLSQIANGCPPCAGTGRAPSEKRPGGTVKCPACKGTGSTPRKQVVSVTTMCDSILPKDGLPPWSEAAGIRGGIEAVRLGLVTPDTDPVEAVAIVRRHKLAADAARDEAADRGLNVHAILERFMLTGRPPNPADHPEPHRPFIRGLVRWLLWADPEPVAVELLVADPERGYAGRLDLLANINGKLTLVDLKTQERGQIHEAAHLQTVLYAEAEERFGEHRPEAAYVVVVNGQGGFDEMELLADSALSRSALDYYARLKPLCAACEQRNRIIKQTLAAAA